MTPETLQLQHQLSQMSPTEIKSWRQTNITDNDSFMSEVIQTICNCNLLNMPAPIITLPDGLLYYFEDYDLDSKQGKWVLIGIENNDNLPDTLTSFADSIRFFSKKDYFDSNPATTLSPDDGVIPECKGLYLPLVTELNMDFLYGPNYDTLILPNVEGVYFSIANRTLKKLSLPKCKTMIGGVNGIHGLTSIELPECESVESSFTDGYDLQTVYLPKCTNIERSFTQLNPAPIGFIQPDFKPHEITVYIPKGCKIGFMSKANFIEI